MVFETHCCSWGRRSFLLLCISFTSRPGHANTSSAVLFILIKPIIIFILLLPIYNSMGALHGMEVFIITVISLTLLHFREHSIRKKIRQGFSTRHPSKEMLTGRWLQMQQKLQLITHNVAYFLQVCSRLASTFTTSNKGINCSNRRKKKIKEDLHDQRHQQYVWMSGVWSHIHDHKRIHRHPRDWICCTPWET